MLINKLSNHYDIPWIDPKSGRRFVCKVNRHRMGPVPRDSALCQKIGQRLQTLVGADADDCVLALTDAERVHLAVSGITSRSLSDHRRLLDADVDELLSQWASEDREQWDREDSEAARELLLYRTRKLLPQLRAARFGELAARCLAAAEEGDARLCQGLSLELDKAEQAIGFARAGIHF